LEVAFVDRPSWLRADCERCVGLCCVAPAFAESADFAIDKPAGRPCPNLQKDFRCAIHASLRSRGFPGCTAYDCFGAGQKVAQVTFGGQNWRRSPELAARMFAVFETVRGLHELLWYLTEPLLPPDGDIRRALAEVSRLSTSDPVELASVDLNAHRAAVGELLRRASSLVRGDGPELARADLTGRDLRGANLVRANLRGAYLIGADLSGADLKLADMLGVDLRGSDLSAADLSTSMFLTQTQVGSANGDGRTRLPGSVVRPAHWGSLG
jgi:uncharacterized protein YjbI with pentapeptide repeats